MLIFSILIFKIWNIHLISYFPTISNKSLNHLSFSKYCNIFHICKVLNYLALYMHCLNGAHCRRFWRWRNLKVFWQPKRFEILDIKYEIQKTAKNHIVTIELIPFQQFFISMERWVYMEYCMVHLYIRVKSYIVLKLPYLHLSHPNNYYQ